MAGTASKSRQVVGKRRERQHVQERGVVRRKKLVAAAEELLAHTPIEELSFRQICEKAGVPEGSAYHFFANRYDLLAAVANTVAQKFAVEYQKPFPPDDIRTWHDLADMIVDRAVEIYRNDPVPAKIWLSGGTPAQIRLADHVSDEAVSSIIYDIFNKVFVMPELPTTYDPFFFFLELSDVPLSISVIEHGVITEEMVEESKRAGKGYLGTYLPPVLEKR